MPQSLSNLPVGAKVKFGKYSVNGEPAQPITWLIAAKDHKGGSNAVPDYPVNSVTLITEKVIDYRFIDNGEPGAEAGTIIKQGRSQYSVSNIDQWLNKDGEAGQWFVKQHDLDHAPTGVVEGRPDADDIAKGVNYFNRPGFLNAFTQDEKNALMLTSIRTRDVLNSDSGVTYSTIDRRVFLPSLSDVGLIGDMHSGETWELFLQVGWESWTPVTEQAYQNSPMNIKQAEHLTGCRYWLRDGVDIAYNYAHAPTGRTFVGWYPMAGEVGIRPALNVLSTTPISDTLDSDGAYTTIFNTAPPAPNTLSVPSTIYGGKNNTISWSSVIDPDGDSVTYELDCVYDGGTVFTTIYKGESLSYSHPVEYGKTSVQYRVRAIDSKGGASGYTTAPSRSVTNNQPPTLAIVSNATTTDVSAKMSYSVFDTEGEKVTIDEYVDDEKIYTHTVQSSSPTTVNMVINALAWTRLSNGSHTIRIKATDTNGGTSEISSTFTKIIETIDITTKPMESSERPARITLTIARVIPEGANFIVFVCNNAFDSAPDWEDATECVLKGDPYMFTNTTKTSSKWAVRVNVIVERNGAEGACYISSIGGAFD